MYNTSWEENYKSRRHSKNKPSFSSTLLDQIYRSIDANAEKSKDLKPIKDEQAAKISQNGFRFKTCSTDDEVGKWMDHDKFTAKRRLTLFPEDNDFLFFSSTSTSSNSSGALSSSDTEFFGSSSSTKSRVPCLASQTRPKPVRTAKDFYLLENCANYQTNKCEDDMIKYKSRASNIYANFKKVKQPISPGGRLTSFLNSLFHNTNGKKGKKLDANKEFQDFTDCSSVTSFSRSCLSKWPLESKEKPRNGNGRTVRFNPLGVIVDEDSRACGHKCIYDEISDKFGRPPLPLPYASAELKSSSREKHREEKTHDFLKGFHSQRKDESYMFRRTLVVEEGIDCDEDDDDGVLSVSSSDLFELDHLNVFGDDSFCEELPVYETTRFDATIRGSVGRLIR